VEIAVALGNLELIATRFQPGLITPADGVHLRIRMMLVNLDELRAESQSHDRNTNLGHNFLQRVSAKDTNKHEFNFLFIRVRSWTVFPVSSIPPARRTAAIHRASTRPDARA